jgi:IS1 family transposase/transposase-like protein
LNRGSTLLESGFCWRKQQVGLKLLLTHTIENLSLLMIICLLVMLIWHHPPLSLRPVDKADKSTNGKKRKWRPKTPHDCPACQADISLTIRAIRRETKPWHERKSSRGRKKTIPTQGYACLNPACDYHGITDAGVHALVGNGKRGLCGDIQTLKCQCCGSSFSTRRNTPLYYLKTHPERVEMCLWLLAEGLDLSVLVRYTGHVDGTLARWLQRAGVHGEHLHALLFINLRPDYLQLDELYAPVAGNKRRSWLWVAIDPVSKLIPAVYLGARKAEDGYRFVHELMLHLAPDCIPAITSDGLRAYFYAITAHFGHWVGKNWVVSKFLLYGQLVKRRNKPRNDDTPYTITRMKWGRRSQLFDRLQAQGFNETIQTAFIERINLTIRQCVAPLQRKTWSLARSQDALLLHVHWWQAFYHFARPHQSLRQRVPGLACRYQPRSPAMAAGLTDHIWSVRELLSLPVIFEEVPTCAVVAG